MDDEIQAVDLEAFEAIDRRRLLRVLNRAIGEEAAHVTGEDHSGERPRSRARLRVLCTIASMLRDLNDSGPGPGAPGSGRRTSRTLR